MKKVFVMVLLIAPSGSFGEGDEAGEKLQKITSSIEQEYKKYVSLADAVSTAAKDSLGTKLYHNLAVSIVLTVLTSIIDNYYYEEYLSKLAKAIKEEYKSSYYHDRIVILRTVKSNLGDDLKTIKTVPSFIESKEILRLVDKTQVTISQSMKLVDEHIGTLQSLEGIPKAQ
jgi:S-methylmethionine-dependent homocysteine/selenocysteine methylase